MRRIAKEGITWGLLNLRSGADSVWNPIEWLIPFCSAPYTEAEGNLKVQKHVQMRQIMKLSSQCPKCTLQSTLQNASLQHYDSFVP